MPWQPIKENITILHHKVTVENDTGIRNIRILEDSRNHPNFHHVLYYLARKFGIFIICIMIRVERCKPTKNDANIQQRSNHENEKIKSKDEEKLKCLTLKVTSMMEKLLEWKETPGTDVKPVL